VKFTVHYRLLKNSN